MRTRFYVFFGCLICAAFYILHISAFGDADIFTIDYRAVLITLMVFFAAVLVFYTFAGTILYTALYNKKQRRIEAYFELLDKLDGYEVAEEVSVEEKDAPVEEAKDESEDRFYDYFRKTTWDELEREKGGETEEEKAGEEDE
jgi:uncharacterized protein YeeX (DUF496 family)